MYYATRHGLENWYHHEFEHLGWMVLAKRESVESESPELRQHMAEKVKMYCSGIKNLLMAIKEKMDKVTEADEKSDLAILYKNTESLKQFASATLMGSQMGGAKRRSRKSKKISRK